MKEIGEIVITRYHFSPSSFSSSKVSYTFTFDCLLNAFSSDQIAQFRDNANAKYSISFECGEMS